MDAKTVSSSKVDFSMFLSVALYDMGYNMEQINWRRNAYRQKDKTLSEICPDSFVITVGSKGEGVSKYFEGDHDVLYIDKKHVCVEKVKTVGLESGDLIGASADSNLYIEDDVIEIDGIEALPNSVSNILLYPNLMNLPCSPGYAILHDRSGNIISSEEFRNNRHNHVNSVKPEDFNKLQQSGPAQTLSIREFNMDIVYGYTCRCPGILNAWKQRPRKHNWPSSEVVETIAEMEAFLVPKGSDNAELAPYEWRFCFNQAENLLIRSLNPTHTNVYILLKIVVKDIIRPQSKQLTSFIIKNLMFWIAEKRDYDHLCLYGLFEKAMRILRRALNSNFLAYYMLPTRNLLSGKMNLEQRQGMVILITRYLEEGPRFLLESERLSKYLTGQIDPGRINTAIIVERLVIERCIARIALEKHIDSPADVKAVEHVHPEMRKFNKAIQNAVFPEWRKCKKKNFDFEKLIMAKLESLLS